jgi:phage FluMu protein Com
MTTPPGATPAIVALRNQKIGIRHGGTPLVRCARCREGLAARDGARLVFLKNGFVIALKLSETSGSDVLLIRCLKCRLVNDVQNAARFLRAHLPPQKTPPNDEQPE